MAKVGVFAVGAWEGEGLPVLGFLAFLPAAASAGFGGGGGVVPGCCVWVFQERVGTPVAEAAFAVEPYGVAAMIGVAFFSSAARTNTGRGGGAHGGVSSLG